jgi:aspartyl-tRNA(Asn)/glutamyl-tRNA(Gln) amidotransferase subunit C
MLTAPEVKKVAKLARVEVSDAEVEKFTAELNKIFEIAAELKEVNTDNVAPMAGVGGYTLRYRDADVVTDGNIQEKVLKNSPDAAYGYFVVPKVVE